MVIFILSTKIYEVARLAQEVTLTEAEEEIRNIVFAAKKPIIAEEVAKKTSGRFKRLKYTTHALRALDSLTNKGVLGKFKRDRLYYFTTPKLLKLFITRAELYKR